MIHSYIKCATNHIVLRCLAQSLENLHTTEVYYCFIHVCMLADM